MEKRSSRLVCLEHRLCHGWNAVAGIKLGFRVWRILQADKSLCLLAFLQNTLRSAADRINKSDFRGRCGTVNYHTVLNL